MNTKYTFNPAGVCCKEIILVLDEAGTIVEATFNGGCPGNLSMISKMIQGKPFDQYLEDFKGHACGKRPTSCMDQFSVMLISIYEDRAGRQAYPFDKEEI